MDVKRLFKYLLYWLLILALISAGMVAANYYHLSSYFPIKTVRVYGLQRVDQQDVQTVLTPLLARGFFSVNVESIRDRLLQEPWVADIFVRRYWPDQVEVTVVEKRAIARWGDQYLLSDTGDLFAPKQDTRPIALPMFVGPEGQQIVMLEYFNQINRLLAPLHAKISYLELNSFRSWKLMLDNGVALQMGHKDILTRLGHFVKVYSKIIGDHAVDVDSVDLRYPNGVAVHWKEPVRI